MANAEENNNNLRAEKLIVKEADRGRRPHFQAGQPAQGLSGSAGPIRKRTSHIRIILTDEIEITAQLLSAEEDLAVQGQRPPNRRRRNAQPEAAKPRRLNPPTRACGSVATPAPAPEQQKPLKNKYAVRKLILSASVCQ